MTKKQAPRQRHLAGGRPRATLGIDGSSKAKEFQQLGTPRNASVSHVAIILRPREAGRSNVGSKRANGGSFRVEGQGLPWYPRCCGTGVASGTRPALLLRRHWPSPFPGLA